MEIKKQSIERGLIKDSPGFQSSITKVLREFSKEFPIATSVCQTICRAELSIDLPKQNPNNFLTIYKENQQIIEFKTISLYNTKNKFDYKKNLSPAHEFKPEEYSKEKERDRIIDMLQKAKQKTLDSFSEADLNDKFFIAVMKVASKNCGIASLTPQKFNEDFFEALKPDASSYKDDLDLHKYAKFFSATFQKLSEEDNYLTCRTGKNGETNSTPRRLFRVCSEENIEKFTQCLQRPTSKGPIRQASASSLLKRLSSRGNLGGIAEQ